MNYAYTDELYFGLEHQKTLLGEPLRERVHLSDGRLKLNLWPFLERAAGWLEARLANLGERTCVGPEPACELPFTG